MALRGSPASGAANLGPRPAPGDEPGYRRAAGEEGRMSTQPAETWPALPYAQWADTRQTLHRWTQIVGKTRLALEPMLNHWWQVALYVSARGLTTSAMPCNGGRLLDVEFDLLAHELVIRVSDGGRKALPLVTRSVADF